MQRDLTEWNEPGFSWPEDLDPEPPADNDLDQYLEVFRRWGFEICSDGAWEDGHLKIAIYAVGSAFQHVAKLLPSRGWSSKVGVLHDIRHEELAPLEDAALLRGATVSRFMRRPLAEGEDFELEESGLILPDSARTPELFPEGFPTDPASDRA